MSEYVNLDDIVELATTTMRQAVAEVTRLRNSEAAAWGLIANAFGGDWRKAGEEWREAAYRWRDEYHKHLPPPGDDKVEEPV